MAFFCCKECLVLFWDHLLPQDIYTSKNCGESFHIVQEKSPFLGTPTSLAHGFVIPLDQRVKPGPHAPLAPQLAHSAPLGTASARGQLHYITLHLFVFSMPSRTMVLLWPGLLWFIYGYYVTDCVYL
jgi:hypothetical protein